MTEPKPYVSIVREPDLRRLVAAARAIEPELERLHSVAAGRFDLLAGLYASRAIVADDEYGRGAGLVIQADGLRWAELDELARLVEPELDPTRHAGAGTWHPRCPDCRGALAAARIRTHRRYRTVGPT